MSNHVLSHLDPDFAHAHPKELRFRDNPFMMDLEAPAGLLSTGRHPISYDRAIVQATFVFPDSTPLEGAKQAAAELTNTIAAKAETAIADSPEREAAVTRNRDFQTALARKREASEKLREVQARRDKLLNAMKDPSVIRAELNEAQNDFDDASAWLASLESGHAASREALANVRRAATLEIVANHERDLESQRAALLQQVHETLTAWGEELAALDTSLKAIAAIREQKK